MKLTRTPTTTLVKFSPSDAELIGLPPKGCYVSYDSHGRLDSYSGWLGKCDAYDQFVDRLVELADNAVRTLH